MPSGVYERSPKEKTRLRKMVTEIAPVIPKGFHISPDTEFKAGHNTWNKGQPYPQVAGDNSASKRPEVREKQRISKLGELNPMFGKNGAKHHNWLGGKTPLIMKIRNSPQCHEWRDAVYTRDNFTCVECGDSSGGNLNAHHKKQLSCIIHENNITTFEEALECSLIWDITNGQTLCESCHQKKDITKTRNKREKE